MQPPRSASGWARALAMGALAWVAGLGLGCKAREGQSCRCAADCRDGLVCVVGTDVLRPGECAPNFEVGICIDDEDVPDSMDALWDMPIFDDMPSKRDLPDPGDGDPGDGDPGDGDPGDGDPGDGDPGDGDPGDGDPGDGDPGDGDPGDGDPGDGDGDPGDGDPGDGDPGDGDPGDGDGG
jgi:hypothetical protein